MSSIITETFIFEYYKTLNLNQQNILIQKLMNNHDKKNEVVNFALIEEKKEDQTLKLPLDIISQNNKKIGRIHKYYILLKSMVELMNINRYKNIKIIDVDDKNKITFLDEDGILNNISILKNNEYILKYYTDTLINKFISLWRTELTDMVEYNNKCNNGIKYANVYLLSGDNNTHSLYKINIRYGIIDDGKKVLLSDILPIYNKAYNNEECNNLINSYSIKIKKLNEYIKNNIKYHIKPAIDCPVCFEKTTNYIVNCNHALCMDCYKRIKYPGLYEYKKCPLCRGDIKNMKKCKIEKI